MTLSAMEKAPQNPQSPREDEPRRPSLKRQDSQKGSLLSGLARKASDKGLPGVAKAMLQLDNKSPERDLQLAELETDPIKKEELIERIAASPIRRGDNPSVAIKSAALQRSESHKRDALNEINTIEQHLIYKNMGQIASSKKSYMYHYQKARLYYMASKRAEDTSAYEWVLEAEADEFCEHIRKEYEKRIKKFLSGSQIKDTPKS
jgi:hypothetical protein